MMDKGRESDSAIELHRQSLKKLRRARKTITVSLVSVILLSIVCLYSSTSHFVSSRMPEVAVELQKSVAPVAAKNISELHNVVDYLYPIYTKEFQTMLETSFPEMKQTLFNELKLLEGYAQGRVKEIEESVSVMAFNQQVLIHEKLVELVGEDEADRVSELYKSAVRERLQTFLLDHLVEHQDVVDSIRKNLDKLARTEPDILPPIELQEAIGMFLELAGIQLQEEA